MPYIAYLPNSRVTLLDLNEVAEVARIGQYAAYGQSLEPPQFAEFPPDDLTGVRRIEGY